MHACGVVHRDLKSANVLLDECGRSHLADFGLARFAINESIAECYSMENLAWKTSTLCTLIYRAPEQLFANGSDGRSLCHCKSGEKQQDLYSMGIVFVEILFNQFFFQIQKSDTAIDAVKLMHVKLYGKQLLEMCVACYGFSLEKAQSHIIDQFPEDVREKVKQLLQRPPLNMKSFLSAAFALRFKGELMNTQYKMHIDSFIDKLAALLSGLPDQRINPLDAEVFKQEIQSIVVSLPVEGLDHSCKTTQELCKIDQNANDICKIQSMQGFNEFGGKSCFFNIVRIGSIFTREIRTFQSWQEIEEFIRQQAMRK